MPCVVPHQIFIVVPSLAPARYRQNNITKQECHTKVFEVLNIMSGIWAQGSEHNQVKFRGKKVGLSRNSTDLPGSDGEKETVGCVRLQGPGAHFAP